MTAWAGSVAMVTGASRGIGEAVAVAAAARGARVGLVARSTDDLERVVARLSGGGHVVAPADVSDRDAVISAARRIEAELGPIDVLVNNAGIGAYGAVVETDPAVFERMMTVNYLGTVWAATAVLPGMLERRRGHVVTIASVAGRMGSPFEAAYSASKFAQVGFSEALAVEVAPFGVTASLVDPGVVDTGFFETRGKAYDRSWPRPIAAERVANAVVKIVERDGDERFVPGALRVAYALKTLVPALSRWGTRRAFVRELDALAKRLTHAAPQAPTSSTERDPADGAPTTERSPQ